MLKSVTSSYTGVGKVFNDPIHGHIMLSPLSVHIIDTPQFQRLRDISQLGGVYYVFTGACSNRFEHSIGVAYLARKFVETLRAQQPELGITDADILCLELAGLCHDLGHGPFSHLFDARLVKGVNPSSSFEHEFASTGILDILIKSNGLEKAIERHGLTSADIHFVQELILGDDHELPDGFKWVGREGKEFLYDIVANKRNGIDVDKFDYFARDCKSLGLTKSFDETRLMKFARVFDVCRNKTTRKELCYHAKEAWNIFELFHTRYALHKRAYQHRVATVVELMIAEALVLADPYIKIPGTGGALRRMSECPDDLEAYWKLGDHLFKQIEHSVLPELQPARDMVHRLHSRNLFRFAGEIILNPDMKKSFLGLSSRDVSELVKSQLMVLCHQHSTALIERKKEERANEEASQSTIISSSNVSVGSTRARSESSVDKELAADLVTLKSSDIFVVVVKIGYGKGKLNPVSDLTTFYKPVKKEDHVCWDSVFSKSAQEKLFTDEGSVSSNTDDNTEDEPASRVDASGAVATAAVVEDDENKLQEQEQQQSQPKWDVGVVPQGKRRDITFDRFISSCLIPNTDFVK